MYEKLNIQSLLFEVTDYCNLNCAHCFQKGAGNKQHMDVASMHDAIVRAIPYGLNSVNISGGEPLLHPDIRKIIDMCDEFPAIMFRLITNGLLLEQDMISCLEKKQNLVVQMSVDGTTKEMYEALRGKNTYPQFVKAFELFRESGLKHKVSRMCVTSRNYQDVENVYELSIKNKIFPTFISVFKMGNASTQWNDLSLSVAQKLIVVDRINRLNRQNNINVAPLLPSRVCSFTEQKERKSLTIKSDGRAAACQHFYNVDIGNVFSDSYHDIFSNTKFLELYDKACKRERVLKDSSMCKSCILVKNCRLGCAGMADNLGNIPGTDGECDYRVALTIGFKSGIITSPMETSLGDLHK